MTGPPRLWHDERIIRQAVQNKPMSMPQLAWLSGSLPVLRRRQEMHAWTYYRDQRIASERDEIRERCGELGLALVDILGRFDPVGIISDANPHEYVREVQDMLPRLADATSPREVRGVIHAELTGRFGEDAGCEALYENLAHEVWYHSVQRGTA